MQRVMIAFVTVMALAGCCPPQLVAVKPPPFPKPPADLMADPPTLDLVPESDRPVRTRQNTGR